MPSPPEYPLDPEELRRRLGKMREGYRSRVPAKIAAIEALWSRVRETEAMRQVCDEARNDLVLAVHTMVGSAPTLGCERLGAAAKALEGRLRVRFARAQSLSEEELISIGRLVEALGQAID